MIISSYFDLAISKFAANWLQRAVYDCLRVAVWRKCKYCILEGLFSERVNRIVRYVLASLVQSSWSSIFVFRCPEVVVSEHSILRPFLIDCVNNLLLTLVLSILQPVGFQNTTAMSTITAEAAHSFLRKSKPSLAIDSIVDARGWDIRDNRSTKSIVSSISPVYSFTVVLWVVELLSINLVVGAINYKSIIKGSIVRVVVDGWLWICSKGYWWEK